MESEPEKALTPPPQTPTVPAKRLKVGAKGKYTPKLVNKILEYIQVGMTNVAACHLCNINEDTYYEWMKVHAEFSEAIKEAEEKAEVVDLDFIRQARPRSWQAAAWRLERRFPERYALKNRHEVSGPGGRPLPITTTSTTKIDLSAITTDTLIEFIKQTQAKK